MSDTPHKNREQQQPRGRSRFASAFLPRGGKLHAGWRIMAGILGNIVLAIYVLPRIGHIHDVRIGESMAAVVIFQAVIPLALLLVLLPVFLFGRDTVRLVAIGLAFLPGYLAIAGIVEVLNRIR